MNVAPDFRLSLALYREADRLQAEMVEALRELKTTPRILGTTTFFNLGCRMMPLVRFLERWGDDDVIWLLAALMARVNIEYWDGERWDGVYRDGWNMKPREARIAEPWAAWHVGAPTFGCGWDGRVLAYWVNVSREVLPKLRRYWFNHLLAASVYEHPAVWIVQTPWTLRQSVWMGT